MTPLESLSVERFNLLDFADRLIRRVNYARRAVLRPKTMATLARLSDAANQPRMLFVVGAGRSGTTAMQRALNASDDVFLLTEANLFWENLKPGFQERYNTRGRDYGPQPSKYTACPIVAPRGSTWVETIGGLLSRYRFVGEKLAFNHRRTERYVSECLAFQYRHFTRATYILMFRNPRDLILSGEIKFGIKDLGRWVQSVIAGTRGLLRMRCNFPRTVPVFLETVGPDTFRAIEKCLDWHLPHLSTMIASPAESQADPNKVPSDLRETVAELEGLYPTLRQAIEAVDAAGAKRTLALVDARLAHLQRPMSASEGPSVRS